MELNVYPVAGYLCQGVRDLCTGSDPLLIFVVRDLVMATAKGEKLINPHFFGRDRGCSEKVVVDAIDMGERNGVLAVEYETNSKGHGVMKIKPTERCIQKLAAAKAEAAARFSR